MPAPLDPQLIAPVTLTGRFVRLEPLTRTHLAAIQRAGADPAIWSWFAGVGGGDEALARWLDGALAAQEARTAIPFATIAVASGALVGSTRFMNIVAHDGRVEIGSTWLAPEAQRTPINTEAKLLMMTHAFETMRVARVELKTHVKNEKSRAAILRIGATFEGVHRHHMRMPDGSMRDTAWYSVIETEWPEVKARLTAMLNR